MLASLALALVYSRDLGLINRSTIAIVMTTNALLWIVITSGATLTLRKIGWENLSGLLLRSFISTLLVQYALILFMFLATILMYSNLKNPITLNLILLSLIYVTTSGTHLIAMELLVSAGRFRSAGLMEVATVLLQIVLYFLSHRFLDFSVAVRLLVALSASYLIISAGILHLLLREKKIKLGISSPKTFYLESRLNYLLGAGLGLMDRIDRLLVGFLLATPILGKYAVATALIALLRFLPDALSKLILARKVSLINFHGLLTFVLALTGSSVIVFLSREIINFWLGPEWVLGLSVLFAIALQELLRGFYQVSANKLILHHASDLVNTTGIYLPIIGVSLAVALTKLFGLIGTPIAFSVSYLFVIIYLRKRVVK